MNFTPEQKQQLEGILTAICEELELTESQRKDAEEKYRAVGKCLADPSSELYQYGPDIYPQGSFSIRTTVKPLGQDEFDLDLVCQLNISNNSSQAAVKELVGRCLRRDAKYRDILEPMNRCWRLNYKSSFHMDILPAIPDPNRTRPSILVPDRELREWKESNPAGYAVWFEDQAKTARAALYEQLQRASVTGLPPSEYIKTPLHRTVQLLKRHRDITFSKEKDKDNAPISIIITTLAARAYRSEISLCDALITIIPGMPKAIQYEEGLPKVKNPTNEKENFAEKWENDPALPRAFETWLIALYKALSQIPVGRGIQAVKESLDPLFGDKLLGKAFERVAAKNEAVRRSSSLYMNAGSGVLGAAGMKVQRNTFYGV